MDDAELVWQLTEKFTQEQAAKAMGWSRPQVSQYAMLNKIDSDAWAVVATSFKESVATADNDVVAEVATTVATPFTEGLLRNILDLSADQQKRLCKWLAKGKELGIEKWPSVVRVGFSETEKRTHARKLNLARRHLTGEQRDKVLLDMRADGMSVRQIADETKIPKSTVARAISSGVPFGTPENTTTTPQHPTTVTGKDGKKYQATQPARKAAEPELPLPRLISIPVAKSGQVAKVTAQARSVIEKAAQPIVLLRRKTRSRACTPPTSYA